MQKKCIIAVDLGIIHNVCVTGYYQEFCVEYYMNSHEWVQTLWSPAVEVHVGAYCASQRFLKRQRAIYTITESSISINLPSFQIF